MSRYFLLKNKDLAENLVSMPEDEAEEFLERAIKVYDKVIELEEKINHKE